MCSLLTIWWTAEFKSFHLIRIIFRIEYDLWEIWLSLVLLVYLCLDWQQIDSMCQRYEEWWQCHVPLQESELLLIWCQTWELPAVFSPCSLPLLCLYCCIVVLRYLQALHTICTSNRHLDSRTPIVIDSHYSTWLLHAHQLPVSNHKQTPVHFGVACSPGPASSVNL